MVSLWCYSTQVATQPALCGKTELLYQINGTFINTTTRLPVDVPLQRGNPRLEVGRPQRENFRSRSRKTSAGCVGEASELLPILLQAWGISICPTAFLTYRNSRIIGLHGSSSIVTRLVTPNAFPMRTSVTSACCGRIICTWMLFSNSVLSG